MSTVTPLTGFQVHQLASTPIGQDMAHEGRKIQAAAACGTIIQTHNKDDKIAIDDGAAIVLCKLREPVEIPWDNKTHCLKVQGILIRGSGSRPTFLSCHHAEISEGVDELGSHMGEVFAMKMANMREAERKSMPGAGGMQQ